MSALTKRKYVFKEVTEEFVLPDEQKIIAKVLAANLGNNLHQVESSTGETFLVSMPTKFRNNIYIRKDTFIMYTPIEEGNKVKGEICHILMKPQIEYIVASNLWPASLSCPVTLKPTMNQSVVPMSSIIPEDMMPSSSEDDDGEEDEDDDGANHYTKKFQTKNPNKTSYDDDDDDDDSDKSCSSDENNAEEHIENPTVENIIEPADNAEH